MKSGSCFILGLPAAGKTSYLAALAYSLEQTDIQTKFKWHKFTENHQYLALLAETWAKGEEVPRTNPGTEQERLNLQLLDSEGQVFQVVFPDLSGETFQKQYRSREMEKELADQIAACGSIMLFVNPGNMKEPELISELPADIRAKAPAEDSMREPAGQSSGEASPMGDMPADAESTETTPTAVQLVVLLQDILFLLENREINSMPLAVVVSAWDVVNAHTAPEQHVKERLPLLWQYLYTHSDQLKVLYYGVSAQGGPLDSEEKSEQLLEKYSAVPVERILVVGPDGEESHDITKPPVGHDECVSGDVVMTKIHQALWGYSNGHYLLASSVPLSNQSLKILGPLSDLSGPAVSKGFDGYLTGHILPTENFYALSKTWYAPEMPRLGCVWTHTLLLDCSSSVDIDQLDLESLFQRPNILATAWKRSYMAPIEFNGAYKREPMPLDIQKIAYCLLSLLTRHSEPIVAIAGDNAALNTALEYLLGEMGLDFFRDFTFCTGSFSNREIDKVPLDLQIIPSSVTRASFRSKRSKMFFLDISQYLCSHNLNAASAAKAKAPQIRNFIRSCGTQYYNYQNWFTFEQIYDSLIHLEKFSVTGILRLLEERISDKRDIATVMGKVFEMVFLSGDNLQRESATFIPALSDFLSTSDSLFGENLFISEKLLKNVLDQMWQVSRKDMICFLPDLIEEGLNAAGERAVQHCAMLLTPNDFSLLLRQAPYLCTLFLRLNWRLALCRDIWRQSKSIQEESLHELRKIMAAKSNIPEECTDIIKSLYQTSQYCFAKEVYEAFGSISIEVFFECFDSLRMNISFVVSQWCGICTYDQSFSIQKLKCVHDPTIFQAVISVINPYQKTVLAEPADVWVDFYRRFCANTTSEDLKRTYAQFILPIILCSKEAFANECAEFAFLTVHKILTENDMEHSRWEKLSELLPKVEWFNEWDKCKRLRMAAENRGFTFDFVST